MTQRHEQLRKNISTVRDQISVYNKNIAIKEKEIDEEHDKDPGNSDDIANGDNIDGIQSYVNDDDEISMRHL